MTLTRVPRVKICGLTNSEDARHAIASGADALGFVLYKGSPRYLAPEQARRLIAELPPFVTSVGLFVNEEPASIREMIRYCGFDTVQLHGDEPPDACSYPPCRVIKALRLGAGVNDETFAAYPVSALLLDACVAGEYGGTGQRCDWPTAARIAARHRLILAGGLTPDNVAEAVRRVRPYAVDVSSGVEKEPGVKDPEKVASFIRMAREALRT
jgi:phosphoribosylanthranilate isomerase